MMLEAKKTTDVPLFTHFPLQSDYVARWEQEEAQTLDKGTKKVLRSIWRNVPFFLRARIQGYREKRRFSFSNTQFYKSL